MEFVERKRSRKSPSFKLVNDAGKQMTADNRRYVSTLECTSLSCSHRHNVASFCSNHSLCLIACVSAAFVVKAFSSSDAFLSLCTSSSVMEYSSLQVCLLRERDEALHSHAAYRWSWPAASLHHICTAHSCCYEWQTSQHVLLDFIWNYLRRFRNYYICSSFKLRACICNICAFMNRTVKNTENSSCFVDILLFFYVLDNSMIFIFPYLFILT